jgi:chaperonin GroEL (HSP60 family)
MFAPVLQSQAKKRIPMIESTKENIEKFLLDSTSIESLEQNLEIIEKALECRKSDIEKAESTSEDYFIKLVKDVEESKKDLSNIDNALLKIKSYT